MKRAVLAALAVIIVFSVFSGSGAKEPKTQRPRFYRPNYVETSIDFSGCEEVMSLAPAAAAAAADTYCVVWYDFEFQDWQGWTSVDKTAQVDTFFHVDDFAGLGGGDYGRLVVLEGSKSLWCGTRPGSDFYLCSWLNAPGYGNSWDQICQSDPVHFAGELNLSYRCLVDSEPEYDFTYVEYDAGDNNWIEIEVYDGVDTLVASHQLLLPQAATKLRFHFISDNGWSDEDGGHDTDGAFIVDSITVSDIHGILDYENFEGFSAGDRTELGIWNCFHADAYGAYAALRNGLIDQDPCGYNMSSIVTFFDTSGPTCGWSDNIYITPFCPNIYSHEPPCQDEMIVSPVIDMNMYSTACDENQDAAIPPGEQATLGGVLLRYAVYIDLPIGNLVFRNFLVRNIVAGCPGQWYPQDIYIPYEPSKVWYQDTEEISHLVTSSDDPIQVALGVVDMCAEWYPTYGDCGAHTPAPWYDNVRIYRYDTSGPQWSVRRGELFQDTFPQEVDVSPDPMEEFCRADMAVDIAPGNEYTRIDPGDSAVVTCSAPLAGGLDTLAAGEARVYCHVNATFLGPDGKPDLCGPQLEGNYGSYVSDDGDWTVLLCEQARYSNGNDVPNTYCIDLNDSLFTRGYMIEYYFKAWSADGGSSTYPANAETLPPSPFFGSSNLLEFTCLPTLRTVPTALYVDDFDGRGTFNGIVQFYFDGTFRCNVVDGDIPDRYDVNGPSSGLGNGVGAYTSVTDASSIFCTAYETVVFDSGDLSSRTISEGTEHSDKSNDAQLLVNWMKWSEHKVGLLVMGDQIASDLDGSYAAVAHELVSTICGVTLESGSYLEMTGGAGAGGIVTPLITGVPGGPFDGLEYYAFGGCPYINEFNVLEKTGPGMYALQYPDYDGQQYYAGIYTDQLNNASQPLRTAWIGHSYQYIRNASMAGMLARAELFVGAWELFENGINHDIPGCDAEIPEATSLSDNFPNPFNPVTRVSFALREKGRVSLRVYDVSGRLVRILVDEIRDAGSYEAVWDGTNDEGRSTTSGIYFCRMEAGDYERTLKMVMLK